MLVIDCYTRSNADYGPKAINLQDRDKRPIDLTGSSFRMMGRVRPADAQAWFDLSTDNGLMQIITATAGSLSFQIPLAALRKMPAGIYVHDCLRTRPDGLIVPFWKGTVYHDVGVTR